MFSHRLKILPFYLFIFFFFFHFYGFYWWQFFLLLLLSIVVFFFFFKYNSTAQHVEITATTSQIEKNYQIQQNKFCLKKKNRGNFIKRICIDYCLFDYWFPHICKDNMYKMDNTTNYTAFSISIILQQQQRQPED